MRSLAWDIKGEKVVVYVDHHCAIYRGCDLALRRWCNFPTAPPNENLTGLKDLAPQLGRWSIAKVRFVVIIFSERKRR